MIVLHRFKVQGEFSFPIDMLRYDCCFPYSEGDSIKIERILRDRTAGPVELGAYQEKRWIPTAGRWESFLWKVTEHSTSR